MRISRPWPLFLTCLLIAAGTMADPIHGVANGAYWHHDSRWLFPAHAGGFDLVGIPQDIAGSHDAAAWYARIVDGARITASVDVYPLESANPKDADTTPASLPVDTLRVAPDVSATRVRWTDDAGTTAVYRVDSNGWRVLIRVASPRGDPAQYRYADAFVLAQRWEPVTAP